MNWTQRLRKLLARRVSDRTFQAIRRTYQFGCRWIYRCLPDGQLSEWQRFVRDGHDQLLTRNLPLDANSTVVDFGGYVGEYAAMIQKAYGCRIHVFEPMAVYAGVLRQRFAGDDKVTIHQCGIADKHEQRTFRVSSDATGEFAEGRPEPVTFESVDLLSEWVPGTLDAIAMNIEGGEYELIPCLARAGVLSRTKRVFVQFHRRGDNPEDSLLHCEKLLAATHRKVWDYKWLWQGWVRIGEA